MENLSLILWFFLIFWCAYNYFLYLFLRKINLLEYKILLIFQKRFHLVPSLYDISKNYIGKHSEVFEEILKLKKQDTFWDLDFYESLKLQGYIHHELNFIFTVINKNTPIQKNGKYLLLKDLFIENSSEIWKKMILYKKIIKKFNFFQKFKNFTLIWFLFPIAAKKDI